MGSESKSIIIRGAQEHNLKHIDVAIPRNKFVVLTGVSGSGKSSLAFDTIYAEAQRRYVESLSAYARQFVGQMQKPKIDFIGGLSPAIAIEQKVISRNPRSTVGTVTEVLDYLRVLYARLGTPHCPQCSREVQAQSAQDITEQLVKLEPGSRLQLLAPLVRQRKGAHQEVLEQARDKKNRRRSGYLFMSPITGKFDECSVIWKSTDRPLSPPFSDSFFQSLRGTPGKRTWPIELLICFPMKIHSRRYRRTIRITRKIRLPFLKASLMTPSQHCLKQNR